MEKGAEELSTWPTGLIEVAPATYSYVQAVGSAGISNAGLILGPDQVLVVDALATIPMAVKFLGHIRCVTPHPISHILLTHPHMDHFLGIQTLLPAQIVSHALCREEMIKIGPDAADQWAKRRPQFAEGLKGVRVCLPEQTFKDRVTFFLGEMEVQFFHLGYGHTRGDGLVYLPNEKVLFAGDVAFFKVTPQGFHGHLGNWINIVNRILDMDIETIVPGHGPIGGKVDLLEMRTYLELVYDQARQCFRQGMSESESVAKIDIGPYHTWVEQERIKDNVERAYQEFRGEVTLIE